MKSWIEVSEAHLRTNFEAIQAAAPGFEVLGVIKADAYGHGAALCAPVLVKAGARWLGVADLEEGLRVREALQPLGPQGAAVHVVVMCGFEPGDAPGIVAADLTAVVWTAAQVKVLEEAAATASRRAAVHLEIETGMARQGAEPGAALAKVLACLGESPRVRCAGVFSHLSSSEVVGSRESAQQEARFEQALAQIHNAGLMPEWLHLGNSSAADEGSTMQWLSSHSAEAGAHGMWRPGLALYGYALPLQGAIGGGTGRLRPELQPVATWTTRVIGVRDSAAGATVV